MNEQVDPKSLVPGTVARFTSGHTVTLARRKEDDSGWWNTDGSGLADVAWEGRWTVPFQFVPDHDGTLDLQAAVFQALGTASVCWSEIPRGVFQSDRAKEVGDALLAFISVNVQPRTGKPDTGRSEHHP